MGGRVVWHCGHPDGIVPLCSSQLPPPLENSPWPKMIHLASLSMNAPFPLCPGQMRAMAEWHRVGMLTSAPLCGISGFCFAVLGGLPEAQALLRVSLCHSEVFPACPASLHPGFLDLVNKNNHTQLNFRRSTNNSLG